MKKRYAFRWLNGEHAEVFASTMLEATVKAAKLGAEISPRLRPDIDSFTVAPDPSPWQKAVKYATAYGATDDKLKELLKASLDEDPSMLKHLKENALGTKTQ